MARHKRRRPAAFGAAFALDAVRSWRQWLKPFVSIAVITLLGVAVLTGIYAGCRDAFLAADRYYDQQGLHDVEIVSTLGLTDDDIAALEKVPGVETVQATRSEQVTFSVDGSGKSATLEEIGSAGLDQPYIDEGTMPAKAGEIGVTKAFVNDTGLGVGDSFTVEPAASSVATFPVKLTITAIVTPPDDLTNADGYLSKSSFRASVTDDFTLYAAPEGVSGDVYTTIEIAVAGAAAEDTFSDDYDALVRQVTTRIQDDVQSERQEAASAVSGVPGMQAQWYVQNRNALSGYNSLKSDVSSIESIGNAFPVLFLIVAVMMSLTTMARLVEEDRGNVGTLLALGYAGPVIALRYLLFALVACLVGGGLGLLAGFLGIPAFLLLVVKGLYVLPDARLEYDWAYGTLGVLLFVVGVGVAAAVAAAGEVRQMPASLMRPKAPKAGARILLERIRPLWRRMSFLNKVTARNIFRFKSRLIMTVGGVAGCTALIVCGLAINDSVNALGVGQYEGVYQYSMMVVSNDADADATRETVLSDGKTTAVLGARVESGELTNESSSHTETVQLIVVPDSELGSLNDMVDLQGVDTRSFADKVKAAWAKLTGGDDPLAGAGAYAGEEVTLGTSGIIVAQSAARSLGIHAGDSVRLRNATGTPHSVDVTAVTRNLIGSDVFISQSEYERLFAKDSSAVASASGATTGSEPVWNAMLAKLSGSSDEQIAYVDQLREDAGVVSAVSCADNAEHFKFDLMAAVVALIVGLAGGLALVVLFTLANTNVSERTREMATLKVLGFYDREVHHYVNREMMELTVLGIVIGLPLGRWIAGLLTSALNMPAMYFEVTVRWYSYAIAAAATLAFALLVQLFVNPVLDRIDPVTSLKSVE